MNRYPIIGIRPTIDGRRRGVRESLEAQTMNMATSVKELIETTLKYPNGENVQCVIADTTIGGVKEAADCKEKFRQENVGLTITVTPCWCYGTETMDLDNRMPHAVWGFNGTERPGAVYLAAVLSAYAQKGVPAFGIYGEHVQESDDDSIPEDVTEKLLKFAKAGLAVALMKDRSYLSMGTVSMGIAGSIVKDEFFQEFLGMRNEYVDMTEFVRRINEEIYDVEEYEKALEWTRENATLGFDNNEEDQRFTDDEKESNWETVVKMALIGRDLMVGNEKLAEKGYEEEAMGHDAILSGFQGQRQWTDHFPNGDFMETMLNSSFDWNGKRAPYVMATENDNNNGVAMLFNYLLTNTSQIFADVRTYWSPEAVKRVTGHDLSGKASNGLIHLKNSGASALDGTGQQKQDGKPVIKPFWEVTDEEVDAMMSNTTFHPANKQYFRGGGYSTRYQTKGEMPMTMTRINIVKGLGPVLQIAEGYSIELPDEVHEEIDQRTDPTWPTTWFAPNLTGDGAFTSAYNVMDFWGSNHCAVSYGHIGSELLTLASMLRIPVNMHNVKKDEVFRPHVWSMFGTQGLESADFRACSSFGPLYK
ncbi:L-fucose isomerase [Salinicoccus hispanicus]|uniref:L-fucose isomerase n=1 Tax=Salinicoccus hispanicus TaxID=157225 RepID=A0A6N8U103_9STAP|nr:L-fucose isomerase [Salinicoccus hispanicus]MXQ51017.1 L-fucose isomerase [Salinicoccus hispanicus]